MFSVCISFNATSKY
uniref:Uncharacterized protein n=1 Tax=Lepeophtheirus salmonis TaxID=72036 RepID=A0A0K2V069_LEPSM